MEEKKANDKPVVRKLLSIKGSLYLCLPKAFTSRHNLHPGDRVTAIPGENLRVVPMEREKE